MQFLGFYIHICPVIILDPPISLRQFRLLDKLLNQSRLSPFRALSGPGCRLFGAQLGNASYQSFPGRPTTSLSSPPSSPEPVHEARRARQSERKRSTSTQRRLVLVRHPRFHLGVPKAGPAHPPPCVCPLPVAGTSTSRRAHWTLSGRDGASQPDLGPNHPCRPHTAHVPVHGLARSSPRWRSSTP